MKRLAKLHTGLLLFSLVQVNCEDRDTPPSAVRQPLSSYVETQKLTVGGGYAFGNAVAFSADGKTALGGAKFDSMGGVGNAGAVYVFEQDDAGNFVIKQKLFADDHLDGFVFGNAVALSSNGNLALIASHSQSEPGHAANGAVYIFQRDARGVFHQQQKIVADVPEDHSYFGYSVALSQSGNTALIGAYGQSTAGGISSGAAYVWVRDMYGSYHQEQKLFSADRASSDYFGHAVALSADGNTAIISAMAATDGRLHAAGAAYVFQKDKAAGWMQTQRLFPSSKSAFAAFGYSLALRNDGNSVLIGAPYEEAPTGDTSAVYRFVRDEKGLWTQEQKIVADDKSGGASFGFSVALTGDGSTALIGAETTADGGKLRQGAAYLFHENAAGLFEQSQKLTASDKEQWARFGGAVALSCDGELSLVGSIYSSDGEPMHPHGAAYVFSSAGASSAAGSACTSEACLDGACIGTQESRVPDPPIATPAAKAPAPPEIPIAQGCALTQPKTLGAFDALFLGLILLTAAYRRRRLSSFR